MSWLLILAGIVLGIILIYLIVIVFFPVLKVPTQPMPERSGETLTCETPGCESRQFEFHVDGIKVAGTLYLPEERHKPLPALVLSQGFGGTRDCLVEEYAIRFVAAGYAVLTYDFRHFGDSDGEPRQLFNISHQLDDLRGVIAFARACSEIDPSRIALWGTSASGGYGLIIAAEDHGIAAVVAQCPAIDHKKDAAGILKQMGIPAFMKLFMHAQRDKGRSRFGLSPHRIPIAGQPGSIALFTIPGTYEGYSRIARASRTFQNEVCARVILGGEGPDPVKKSEDVECPVLFLVCEQDRLASPESYVRAVEKLHHPPRIHRYPIGHFEIYDGQHFEGATADTIAFLDDVLKER